VPHCVSLVGSLQLIYCISLNRSPQPLLVITSDPPPPACIPGPACIQGPACISTSTLWLTDGNIVCISCRQYARLLQGNDRFRLTVWNKEAKILIASWCTLMMCRQCRPVRLDQYVIVNHDPRLIFETRLVFKARPLLVRLRQTPGLYSRPGLDLRPGLYSRKYGILMMMTMMMMKLTDASS